MILLMLLLLLLLLLLGLWLLVAHGHGQCQLVVVVVVVSGHELNVHLRRIFCWDDASGLGRSFVRSTFYRVIEWS